ncbi:MAG TPA: class I SAM-dependent methyltransferase [Ktedonobacteraceae bacterium]|nr:class I SAM-dependent methyltransferase [Ktedonobacteraceae bacterium]
MESAIERWQAIIDARARQMDAAYARLGRTSADFWNRRARGYHRSTKDTVSNDPFYRYLIKVISPATTVLDVGAGTGRFALALAPLVRQVIAVEPNAAMLDYLRQDAQERGITNISYSQSTWQDTPNEVQADIVICSHVLYPIRDIAPFLAKLHHAAGQAYYIYMRATPMDTLTAPLWKHFHGDDRCMPPGYIHALDVLYEMGLYANVEVVNLPPTMRFPSLDRAVEELLEQLILPDDQPTREELRSLLQGWLVEQDDALVPPAQEMVCGILYSTTFRTIYNGLARTSS